MELRQYWLLARKWMWLLVLGAALVGGISFLISRRMTPVYQTSTTLLVTPGTAQSLDNYTALVASERLAQTYAQLVGSSPVMQESYERIGVLAAEDPDLGDQGTDFSVAAEPVRDTQLIRVQITGTDPEYIAVAGNTVVQVFIEWLNELQRARYAESKANLASEMERVQSAIRETEATIGALQAAEQGAQASELGRLQDQLAQYRSSYSTLVSSYSNVGLAEASSGDTVNVVSPAPVPSAPFRPQVAQNTLLAAVVGAMLAAGVAFLIEYLDDTVKEPADVAAAGLGVLATIQRIRDKGKGRSSGLFAMTDAQSLVAESYRTLRTNLQFSPLDKLLHTLVVASAVASEGKTTTAANLAVVMAQAGKRVVLVDADLRRPAVHKMFDLPNHHGVTDALRKSPAALNGYLHATQVKNLQVLTSGPLPPNPQELLGSQRMQDLLQEIEQVADLVVIDTAAALPVADVNVLAARTDGVLMVVNAGKTRRAALHQAAANLRRVGGNVLGIVFNMVDQRSTRSYYSQYHYYLSGYEPEHEQGGRNGLGRRVRRLRR